jgi:hypothetical protein
MRRKRNPRTPPKPSDLVVERDVASDVAARAARPPEKRYSNLKMPHERDESTHAPAAPSAVTEQAADDIESGKRETDCYGTAGENFDRSDGKR